MANARISSGGITSRPISKCTSERAVCAPQYTFVGTSMAPILSVSIRVCVCWGTDMVFLRQHDAFDIIIDGKRIGNADCSVRWMQWVRCVDRILRRIGDYAAAGHSGRKPPQRVDKRPSPLRFKTGFETEVSVAIAHQPSGLPTVLGL